MNARQEMIIHQKMLGNSWVKAKELANLTGVTTRTIRSDIEAINLKYSGLIESCTRNGYKINQEKFEKIEFSEEEQIPQTPQERIIYIIKSLLLNNKKLKIITLALELYVSEHTIETDIKKIRELIKPYKGLKLIRTDNRLYFSGDEGTKRKLYKKLLEDEIQGNFLNLNKIAVLYDKFDLLQVISIFENVLASYNYAVRQEAIPMITVHIGVTIERMLSGNYLIGKDVNKQMVNKIEYDISKIFFEEIVEIIPIEYQAEEVAGLARTMLGYRDVSSLQNEIDCYGEAVNIPLLLEEITKKIQATFDLDFSKDKDFTNGLHLHIQSLVARIQNKSIVPNAHLQETKRSYPLVFEIAVHVKKVIMDHLGVDISESETGFIALHIGAAYDRLLKKEKYKYRVLLIAPQNESFLKLTKSKIINMFKDRIEIVNVSQYLIEEDVLDAKIDLIISTLPIQHSLDIKTVQISMFVGYEDESKIFSTLNQLDKESFVEDIENQFVTLIDDRFYFTDLDLDTPEEVIEYMSKELEKERVVSTAFTQSVLDREKMASTSFVYSVAIPHPLVLESNQSKIAVGILKEPIKWGSYMIQLVMMPAIKEKDSTRMWLFFDWLSETITNSEKMAKLIDSKTQEEFVYWMMND